MTKQLHDFIGTLKNGAVVCYGVGYSGKRVYEALDSLGAKLSYFADTYKFGGEFMGLPVLSPNEVVELGGGIVIYDYPNCSLHLLQ